MRTSHLIGLTLSAGVALVIACGSDPPSSYGNPNTLSKVNFPGGNEAGIEPINCADAGVGGGGDGGGGGEGGACVVSWSAQLFPKYQNAWKCASADCHAPGKTAPELSNANASAARQSLIGANTTKVKKPYLNPGSTDPNQSSIYCNLFRACEPSMPQGGTSIPLSGPELCQLEAWLRCGAPDN